MKHSIHDLRDPELEKVKAAKTELRRQFMWADDPAPGTPQIDYNVMSIGVSKDKGYYISMGLDKMKDGYPTEIDGYRVVTRETGMSNAYFIENEKEQG